MSEEKDTFNAIQVMREVGDVGSFIDTCEEIISEKDLDEEIEEKVSTLIDVAKSQDRFIQIHRENQKRRQEAPYLQCLGDTNTWRLLWLVEEHEPVPYESLLESLQDKDELRGLCKLVSAYLLSINQEGEIELTPTGQKAMREIREFGEENGK